jgi:glycosyltransferase involved in cell wall biosynthesis
MKKMRRLRIKLGAEIRTLSYLAATLYFSNNKRWSARLIAVLFKKWAFLFVYQLLGGAEENSKISLFWTEIKPSFRKLNQRIDIKKEPKSLISIIINGVDSSKLQLINCLCTIAQNIKSTPYEIIIITEIEDRLAENVKQVSPDIADKENLAPLISTEQLLLINACQVPITDGIANGLAFLELGYLVTSKLIFASNGLIKSAGAMYKNNVLNYNGLFSNPNNFDLNYVKEVDAAVDNLLVNTSDFFQIENINSIWYKWETSLATISTFLSSHLNKKIVYHPLVEFITFQDELSELNYIQISNVSYINQEVKKKSILVIDAVYPTPDKDSGSRRLFELIKLFKSLNLEVYFLAHEAVSSSKYINNLINAGIRVFQGRYHREKQFTQLRKHLTDIDFAWISRPDMNEIYGAYIKQENSAIKWIYDTVDLHFIREERAKKLNSDVALVIDENIEELKRRELSIANLADYTVTVTDVEKEILEQLGIEKVCTVPNVHPTTAHLSSPAFNERNGLLFIGSYLHQPNIDAAVWMVKEIMPIVWQSYPEIKLFLLGSNPNSDVLSLASEKVIVPGYLEEVAHYFLASRIFVAPLRFGAGMKGKIGQSLEFGLPIVSTEIGVEGMHLTNGINCMVADDAPTFAKKIIELYSNQSLWLQLHENSLAVIDKYSPASVTENLKKILFPSEVK